MSHFFWAHRLSELMSKWLAVSLVIIITLFAIYPGMCAAYFHLSGSSRPSMWIMSFDVDMPFDIGTPLGYLMGVGIQFSFTFCNSMHTLVGLIMFFGGCLFAMSYVNDLQDFYRHLDEEYVISHNNRVLRERLIRAVRQHLTFMEWFKHFAQISSGFLFFEIGSCAISTSASIFLFLVSIYLIQVNV